MDMSQTPRQEQSPETQPPVGQRPPPLPLQSQSPAGTDPATGEQMVDLGIEGAIPTPQMQGTVPETPSQGGIGTWMKNFGTRVRQTFWRTKKDKSEMSEPEVTKMMSRRKFLAKSGSIVGGGTALYFLGNRSGQQSSSESANAQAKKKFEFRESALGRPATDEEKMIGMPEIYKDNPEVWTDRLTSQQRDNIRTGNAQLVSEGVVDKQGHLVEQKKPEKGGKKPGDVRTALSDLNSLWSVAPVPTIEALGWLANGIWSSEIQLPKIMGTSRAIEGTPPIPNRTQYQEINLSKHSEDQLRALHDEILATQGRVHRLMREVDSRESAGRVLLQVSYLAYEVFQMGLSLTGILSVRGGHNALGIGAAYLVHKLRTAVRGDATNEMAEQALRDLTIHLTRIDKAIEARLKASQSQNRQPAVVVNPPPLPPQAPPPPAVNPAQPPPPPQPPSNPNPAGGQAPTP